MTPVTTRRAGGPALWLVLSLSTTTPLHAQSQGHGGPDAVYALSALSVWDDGLAEMSSYRAIDEIYGRQRAFTRVHIVNRQWMDPERGVKCEPDTEGAVPVFKLNICEEVPTENYNYRYQTTVFLKRPGLDPFKTVVSSQEWCGTTFKHLRWKDDLSVERWSYFPGEGHRVDTLGGDVVPYAALTLIARDVAATGGARDVRVLASMRSNRAVPPNVTGGTLVPGTETKVRVEAGEFLSRRVDLEWDGPRTGFIVEVEPPHRLLRFWMEPVRGELVHVERRAYWDRDWPSSFHKPGEAP